MKYVKKDNVVKEVSDEMEGNYVSAGWKPTDKTEFDKTEFDKKVKPEKSAPRENPEADR